MDVKDWHISCFRIYFTSENKMLNLDAYLNFYSQVRYFIKTFYLFQNSFCCSVSVLYFFIITVLTVKFRVLHFIYKCQCNFQKKNYILNIKKITVMCYFIKLTKILNKYIPIYFLQNFSM
jgi:hypothetical protein